MILPRRPEPALLTPAQVHALLQSDWRDPGEAVELRRDLALSDVAHTRTFTNARILLEFARERGGLELTPRRNLKVSVVVELIDRLVFDPDYIQLHRSVSRRIIEEDIVPLNALRVVCELGELLRFSKQRFVVTRNAARLLADAHAGELFAHLFHTWFRRFAIDYVTAVEWPSLQDQLAYTLYRLPTVAAEWRTEEDLLPEVVLPFAFADAPRNEFSNLAAWTLGSAVLDPLVDFGLLERRPQRAPDVPGRDEQYRTTPLASAFLRFNL